MGNDAPCKVVGIGTVQIKMHDGVVRTITDIRHVQDLKRNLISLGTLNDSGCKYVGEGGVLRKSKRSLTVMKVLKKNGLYVLQGNTITGSVTVSSSDKEVETTKL